MDFNVTEKAVYAKYKEILKVNSQQVERKNAEAWRGFFSLIKEKRRGELPKWLKPRPPGYWKEGGRYKLVIVVRNDRYTVNEESKSIYLKDWKITLKFKGKLKWRGKQGRLEMIYNEARRTWYANMPIEVEAKAQASGNLRASIDLGIVNLATVYVEDGSWFLFKGGSVLAQYEHYSKKIASVQKLLARHKQRTSRRLKLLHEKRSRYLKHALNSMVRRIMELLRGKSVGKLVVGHPKDIARRRGNKLTVNFWSYNYIIKRLREVGKEVGIDVVEADEAYTSITCSLCGEAHEGGRVKRGLFKCPRTGKVINADLNGAINILHIPESLGAKSEGQLLARDRGNGPEARPAVYRWTSRAGWVLYAPASDEAVKVKAVNHKPMNRPKGTLTLKGGGEVSSSRLAVNIIE